MTQSAKKGPIVITQVSDHYLVRIPVDQGDRARKVSDYQWDGNRKMWIYPKTSKVFDALENEFKSDADVFALQRPVLDSPSVENEIRVFDDPQDEQNELTPQSELQPNSILDEIPQMLHGLQDNQLSHNRNLQDILGKQDEIALRLSEIEVKSGKVSKEIKIVTELPKLLDLSNSEHLELFERALITVAYLNATESQSFKKWVFRQSPLKSPSEFVINTHEHIKTHLEKITGKDHKSKFWELVKEIKSQNLIYCENVDEHREIYQQLQRLTNIRNKFSHCREPMSQAQKATQSIVFLMDLSSVWGKVVVEDQNEVNTTN